MMLPFRESSMMRNVVVAGDSTLEFSIRTRINEAALVLDGHEKLTLEETSRFEISRASKDFLLVTTAQRSYYYLLRKKLGWGEKPRYREPEPGEDEP